MFETFSAHREISSTPHTTTIVHVGYAGSDRPAWHIYAKIEFVRRSGAVLKIYPSAGAVHERLIDRLVECAIAYHNGTVVEVNKEKQPSRGIAPDLVFYTIQGDN